MNRMLLIFFIVIFGWYSANGAKVLFVPCQHYSFFHAQAQLGQALAEQGHDVWILTLDENKSILPKTSVVKPLLFSLSSEARFGPMIENLMKSTPSGDRVFQLLFDHYFQNFGLYCEEIMQNVELMEIIGNTNFDIVIMDDLDELICMYMLPYRFEIPYISYTSDKTQSWYAGVTGLPSIEPDQSTLFSNRMSFWQRLQNLHAWIAAQTNPFSDAFSESHMKKYAPHRPQVSFTDIRRQSEMFLINQEVMCLDYPRVSAPNYQFLGAVSPEPAKSLVKGLDNFVAGAEHGIVVMSLGSHKAFQMVWKILREKMFRALGQLPQRIIVQYIYNDSENVPSNIKLMDWIPQNDLLAHPKTKLFITHGGKHGQNQAIFHGVPSLVIPCAFDQYYNGVRVESHSYGKYVRDKEAVTSEELYKMMLEIITNGSYSSNTRKCSKIIKSMPSPEENFVFWVNHVLDFGGDHLKPPSLKMPLYKVLMLDIIALYACLVVVGFYTLAFGSTFTYSWLFRKSTPQSHKRGKQGACPIEPHGLVIKDRLL